MYRIRGTESEIKGAEYEPIDIKAGIRNLDKYEYYNQLNMLAGDDILRINAVAEMPVVEVILKLRYEADKALINKRRIDIMNQEAKQKR